MKPRSSRSLLSHYLHLAFRALSQSWYSVKHIPIINIKPNPPKIDIIASCQNDISSGGGNNPFGEDPVDTADPFEDPVDTADPFGNSDNTDPIKDPSDDEETDTDAGEAPVPKTLPCGTHAPINGDFEDVKVDKFKIYFGLLDSFKT